MKHHDHYHCPICAAKFATEADLEHHDKTRHTQQGLSGSAPSNEYPPSGEPPVSDRKDREFTRRNQE